MTLNGPNDEMTFEKVCVMFFGAHLFLQTGSKNPQSEIGNPKSKEKPFLCPIKNFCTKVL